MTDGADVVALGQEEKRAGDGREEVGMFVGVEVGDVDADLLELLYLREGFALDVLFADPAAQEGLNKIDERGPKGFTIGAEKSGDALRV